MNSEQGTANHEQHKPSLQAAAYPMVASSGRHMRFGRNILICLWSVWVTRVHKGCRQFVPWHSAKGGARPRRFRGRSCWLWSTAPDDEDRLQKSAWTSWLTCVGNQGSHSIKHKKGNWDPGVGLSRISRAHMLSRERLVVC